MKISQITNNNIQNKNISTKGSVSPCVRDSLYSYAKVFAKNAKLAEQHPQTFKFLPTVLTTYTSKANTYAQNVLKNMNIIMSRFAEDCVLRYDFCIKNPNQKYFYINNQDSDYIIPCGSINLAHEKLDEDFDAINDFVNNNLAEINPFDANRNFKIQSKVADNNFAPEKVFMNLEDRFVYMKQGLPPESQSPEKQIPVITLLNEMREFEEKFKDDDVHMLWFNV